MKKRRIIFIILFLLFITTTFLITTKKYNEINIFNIIKSSEVTEKADMPIEDISSKATVTIIDDKLRVVTSTSEEIPQDDYYAHIEGEEDKLLLPESKFFIYFELDFYDPDEVKIDPERYYYLDLPEGIIPTNAFESNNEASKLTSSGGIKATGGIYKNGDYYRFKIKLENFEDKIDIKSSYQFEAYLSDEYILDEITYRFFDFGHAGIVQIGINKKNRTIEEIELSKYFEIDTTFNWTNNLRRNAIFTTTITDKQTEKSMKGVIDIKTNYYIGMVAYYNDYSNLKIYADDNQLDYRIIEDNKAIYSLNGEDIISFNLDLKKDLYRPCHNSCENIVYMINHFNLEFLEEVHNITNWKIEIAEKEYVPGTSYSSKLENAVTFTEFLDEFTNEKITSSSEKLTKEVGMSIPQLDVLTPRDDIIGTEKHPVSQTIDYGGIIRNTADMVIIKDNPKGPFVSSGHEYSKSSLKYYLNRVGFTKYSNSLDGTLSIKLLDIKDLQNIIEVEFEKNIYSINDLMHLNGNDITAYLQMENLYYSSEMKNNKSFLLRSKTTNEDGDYYWIVISEETYETANNNVQNANDAEGRYEECELKNGSGSIYEECDPAAWEIHLYNVTNKYIYINFTEYFDSFDIIDEAHDAYKDTRFIYNEISASNNGRSFYKEDIPIVEDMYGPDFIVRPLNDNWVRYDFTFDFYPYGKDYYELYDSNQFKTIIYISLNNNQKLYSSSEVNPGYWMYNGGAERIYETNPGNGKPVNKLYQQGNQYQQNLMSGRTMNFTYCSEDRIRIRNKYESNYCMVGTGFGSVLDNVRSGHGSPGNMSYETNVQLTFFAKMEDNSYMDKNPKDIAGAIQIVVYKKSLLSGKFEPVQMITASDAVRVQDINKTSSEVEEINDPNENEFLKTKWEVEVSSGCDDCNSAERAFYGQYLHSFSTAIQIKDNFNDVDGVNLGKYMKLESITLPNGKVINKDTEIYQNTQSGYVYRYYDTSIGSLIEINYDFSNPDSNLENGLELYDVCAYQSVYYVHRNYQTCTGRSYLTSTKIEYTTVFDVGAYLRDINAVMIDDKFITIKNNAYLFNEPIYKATSETDLSAVVSLSVSKSTNIQNLTESDSNYTGSYRTEVLVGYTPTKEVIIKDFVEQFDYSLEKSFYLPVGDAITEEQINDKKAIEALAKSIRIAEKDTEYGEYGDIIEDLTIKVKLPNNPREQLIFTDGIFVAEYGGSTIEENPDGTDGELFRIRLVREEGTSNIYAGSKFIISYHLSLNMNTILDENNTTFRTSEYYNGELLNIYTNTKAERIYTENITSSGIVSSTHNMDKRFLSYVDADNHTLNVYSSAVNYVYLSDPTMAKLAVTRNSTEEDRSKAIIDWEINYNIKSTGKEREISLSLRDLMGLDLLNNFSNTSMTEEEKEKLAYDIERIFLKHTTIEKLGIYYKGVEESSKSTPIKYKATTTLYNAREIHNGTVTGITENHQFEVKFNKENNLFNFTVSNLENDGVLYISYNTTTDIDAFLEEAQSLGYLDSNYKLKDINNYLSINLYNELFDGTRETITKSGEIEIMDAVAKVSKKYNGESGGITNWTIKAKTGTGQTEELLINDKVEVISDDTNVSRFLYIDSLSIKYDGADVYKNGEFLNNWTGDNLTISLNRLEFNLTFKDTENLKITGGNKEIIIDYRVAIDENDYSKYASSEGTYALSNKTILNKKNQVAIDSDNSTTIEYDNKLHVNKTYEGSIGDDLSKGLWKIVIEPSRINRNNLVIIDELTENEYKSYISLEELQVYKTIGETKETLYDSTLSENSSDISVTAIDNSNLLFNENGNTDYKVSINTLQAGESIEINYILSLDPEAYLNDQNITDLPIDIDNNVNVKDDLEEVNIGTTGYLMIPEPFSKTYTLKEITIDQNKIIKWTIDVNLTTGYEDEVLENNAAYVIDKLNDSLMLNKSSIRAYDRKTTSSGSELLDELQLETDYNYYLDEANELVFEILQPHLHKNIEISFETELIANAVNLENYARLRIGGIEEVVYSETIERAFTRFTAGTISSKGIASYKILADKYLDDELSKVIFNFELTEVDENREMLENGYHNTFKNNEEGKIESDLFKFKREGTHYYLLKEVNDHNPLFEYDNNYYLIKLDVELVNNNYVISDLIITNSDTDLLKFNNYSIDIDEDIIENPNTGNQFKITLFIISLLSMIFLFRIKKHVKRYNNI